MSDPYGDAEASRYDNPVASRKWLLELLEQAGRPLDYEEMASLTQTIESIARDCLPDCLRCVVTVKSLPIGSDVMCWWTALGWCLAASSLIGMGLDFLNRMTMGIGSIYMIGRCEGISW